MKIRTGFILQWLARQSGVSSTSLRLSCRCRSRSSITNHCGECRFICIFQGSFKIVDVYQDPMDWNVIAYMEGKCPKFEKLLAKVTIGEVVNNLKDNGYGVKRINPRICFNRLCFHGALSSLGRESASRCPCPGCT